MSLQGCGAGVSPIFRGCRKGSGLRECYNVRGFDALYGWCSAREGVQQQQWAAHSFEGSDAMSRGLMLCRGGARCTGVDRGLAAAAAMGSTFPRSALCPPRSLLLPTDLFVQASN